MNTNFCALLPFSLLPNFMYKTLHTCHILKIDLTSLCILDIDTSGVPKGFLSGWGYIRGNAECYREWRNWATWKRYAVHYNLLSFREKSKRWVTVGSSAFPWAILHLCYYCCSGIIIYHYLFGLEECRELDETHKRCINPIKENMEMDNHEFCRPLFQSPVKVHGKR